MFIGFEPKLTPNGEVNILLNFGDSFFWSDETRKNIHVKGNHVTGPRRGSQAIKHAGIYDWENILTLSDFRMEGALARGFVWKSPACALSKSWVRFF